MGNNVLETEKLMITVHYDHHRGMIPVKTERFWLVLGLFSGFLN